MGSRLWETPGRGTQHWAWGLTQTQEEERLSTCCRSSPCPLTSIDLYLIFSSLFFTGKCASFDMHMGAHVCDSRLMSGISLYNSSLLFIEITLELDATVQLTCSRNLLSLPLTAAVMGGPRLSSLRIQMQVLML